MAIPVNLQKFKATGIYRVVYDKSVIKGVDAEILRLVVGYSEKGPFNTPVYITSVSEFEKYFGKGSRKLEKRGVFFHRLAKQALQSGPILALNLKVFEGENVGAIGFNPGDLQTPEITTALNEALAALHAAETTYNNAVIALQAFGSLEEPNEVSEPDEVTEPSEVKEPTKPADDATDAEQQKYETDLEAYNTYLTNKKSYDTYVAALKKYNDYTANKDAYETYKAAQEAYISAQTAYDAALEAYNADTTKHGNFAKDIVALPVESIYDTSRFWKLDDQQLADADKALNGYIRICATDTDLNGNTIVIRKTVDSATLKSYDVTVRDWYATESEGVPEYLEDYLDHKINEFLVDVYVFRGKFTSSMTDADSLGAYIHTAPAESEDYEANADNIRFKPYVENAFGDKLDVLDKLYYDDRSGAVAKYTGFTLPYFQDKTGVYQSLDLLFNTDNDIHQMMMYFDVASIENDKTKTANLIMPEINIAENADYVDYPTAYLHGYTYEHPLPHKYTTSGVNDTEIACDDVSCKYWIDNYILKALTAYKGLRIGLCTKAEIDYRYIIDTFKSYVGDECKAILSALAQEKQNAFAILNFPAVETLKKYQSIGSEYAFLDKESKQFDIEKVVKNGSGFSLPSEANGASFCAFYTPLKFSENGIPSIVPSAALVSNNFMEKYTSRFPYYIVAGQNYGLITATNLVGPDYNWSQDELQVIEPYGVNCMMYRARVGTFINANQTAKQTPKSALSLVNVRELVIYLQDEIEKVLQQYHWEINSSEVRAKIKDRADYICQQVKKNNGLYAFLNVMDETNNDADIIDNEMAVLSTHIEPGKGCGKMVQELTIYRTGGMSAALSE